MRAQRIEITERVAPAREHAALDLEIDLTRRTKHAHAAHGIVAREHDDFHAVAVDLVALVEGEELLHEREGDADACGHVEAVELVLPVRSVVAAGHPGLVHAVLFFEVEQRARGYRDNEFVLERDRHGGSETPVVRR